MKLSVKFKWGIFTCLYILVIFFLSLRPSPKINIIGREIIQNLAHVPIYGCLAFLLISGFRKSFNQGFSFIFAFITGLVVALADEFLQSFTPGRTVSMMDILLDISGIVIMMLLFKCKLKLTSGGNDNGSTGTN